ncbi:MAG: DUF2970 domain-containing protein [Gammaproteobacteria bacterium]
MTTDNEDMQNEDVQRKQPFWRNMLSVMQASFGVQSKKNQERDFANGSIGSFVVAALIFTTLFVLTLVVVVRSVLP